jgi:hypothetical protein
MADHAGKDGEVPDDAAVFGGSRVSIKATNWAMHQIRTDGPSAQSVLFVVADVANAEGICRHADPDYIAERTRQSRATVFRRLAELEGFGALLRLSEIAPDGSRRYEIRLMIAVQGIDYDGEMVAAWRKGQRDDDDDEGPTSVPPPSPTPPIPESQIETHPESQIETERVAPVRPGESHSCDSVKNPRDSKKETPNPLSGGVRGTILDQESEDRLIRFIAEYPNQITDYPKTRAVWAALTGAEQADAIIGAKGYQSFIAGDRKRGGKRAVKDAHRWLRDRQWIGYLKSGQMVEAHAGRFSAKFDSDEWREWTDFYRCCGYRTGIPSHLITGTGSQRIANVQRQWPPDIGKDRPVDWTWTFSDGAPQFAAWRRRLHEIVPHVNLFGTITFPSEWPPSKGSTGPPNLIPGTLATESDLNEMAKG